MDQYALLVPRPCSSLLVRRECGDGGRGRSAAVDGLAIAGFGAGVVAGTHEVRSFGAEEICFAALSG